MNVKRKTAMEAACLISSTALHKYGEKVVEVIGENKDREVRDEIAKDYLKREPIKSKQIIITNKGDVRCFDVLSGRYFQSTIDNLNKAANDLNRRMRDEYAISLNDFYWEIGLDNVKLGDMLGWNIDRGYIELDFSAQIADDNIPCIVVGYRNPPTYMC